MSNHPFSVPGGTPVRRAAVVAGIYAVLGVLWILFSDDIIGRVATDAGQLNQMQTLKGWFFVLVTALILFFLVRRACRGLEEAHGEASRASVDELTGLPGQYRLRRLLAETVEQARLDEVSMAVVVLDVLHLRRINEAFGISAGDNLLVQMADRLRDIAERADVRLTITRPGSGQFLVLCHSPCDTEQAQSIAGIMVERLTVPYQVGSGSITLMVHAGIAVYPRDGFGGRQLRRAAEMAIFDAKRLRMPVALFRDRSEQVREQLALENDLRQALRRRQFLIYFQPLVRIEDGCIVGAEALLRWQHPVHGLIGPDRFIPLLEESGDILAVGDWVMREATRFAAGWAAEGEPLSVTVNVSRMQMESRDFVHRVDQAVSEAGLAPDRLTIEITESLVMTNPQVTMERMTALRDIGVRLAMDDFGTGYSSLAYLKRYPLDMIKVDRSFVQGIPDDRENDLLMETITDMSHRLQRRIVAEGVERRREASRLLEIGCEFAQGYLFSRPLPADQFLTLLQSGRFLTLAEAEAP